MVYFLEHLSWCYFSRDLKASNVFMNKTGTCKIGDFGIAKSMNNTIEVASTCVGTPCYLSPEMCQDIPYSSKADVWVSCFCFVYKDTNTVRSTLSV